MRRNGIEGIADEVRIDIVENDETFVRFRVAQCGVYRRGPEGGTADAQYQDVRIGMGPGKVRDGFYRILIGRQIAEGQLDGCVCALNVIDDVFRRVRGLIKRDLRNPMSVDRFFQYVRVIKFEQCFLSPR